MPDILRLRFTGPHTAAVPVLGHDVEPDQVVDVPGRVLDDGQDAYLVEFGNPAQERVFPKSMWSVEAGAKSKEASK